MSVLHAGFAGTVQWVFQHGYFFIFLLMLVEGPVVTAAAAFAAALGYLNIWIVLLLSVLGNLIPDAISYAAGYWGRGQFVDRYGHYVGLTPEKLKIAEKLLAENAGKALFTIKMVPLLATPGLITAGIVKMNLRQYIWWCIAITIPSSAIYLVLGYYFGAAYTTIDHYLHIGVYVIIAGAIIISLFVYFQRRYFNDWFKKSNR
jgi:membrane protein DedA with SNARE-associated domain